MRDHPNSMELLRAARRVVLETLLPALPAGETEPASLVATALAIAIGECKAGDAPLIVERAALAEFYQEVIGSREPLDDALLRLNSRLAADLRAGRLSEPGARRHAAARMLKQVAQAKLDEVAPDYPRTATLKR